MLPVPSVKFVKIGVSGGEMFIHSQVMFSAAILSDLTQVDVVSALHFLLGFLPNSAVREPPSVRAFLSMYSTRRTTISGDGATSQRGAISEEKGAPNVG